MPRLEAPETMPVTLVGHGSTKDNRTAAWRNVRPAIKLAECTGCLICWKFCPDACVDIVDGKPVIDEVHCKGCGICARECPPRCVSLEAESL